MLLAAVAESDATVARSVETPLAVRAVDLDRLFREHHYHLLRFVQRYLRNPQDAEDVVQSTFIEALRCADRYAGLSKPSTWLFGIALNLARNQARRNCTEIYDPVDEAFIDAQADERNNPAQMAELRQMVGKVEALLAGLSAEIRTTFETVLDRDATYQEAARELHIPVGTVRSRVSRVRSAARLLCA
jgi:RNA polymerase sigma factor (sigma-70 family)